VADATGKPGKVHDIHDGIIRAHPASYAIHCSLADTGLRGSVAYCLT